LFGQQQLTGAFSLAVESLSVLLPYMKLAVFTRKYSRLKDINMMPKYIKKA